MVLFRVMRPALVDDVVIARLDLIHLRECCHDLLPCVSKNAAAKLVPFHRLEQRPEVAFAETLVALALNNIEEDRTDYRGGEDLKQRAAALGRCAVDQDAVAPQSGKEIGR